MAYTKQKFEDGQKLKAEHLNNIENGIETNSNDIQTINNELANKATEEYVNTKVSELVNSAPEALNTLGELATAIEENGDLVGTLNEAIGSKADKEYVDTKVSEVVGSAPASLTEEEIDTIWTDILTVTFHSGHCETSPTISGPFETVSLSESNADYNRDIIMPLTQNVTWDKYTLGQVEIEMLVDDVLVQTFGYTNNNGTEPIVILSPEIIKQYNITENSKVVYNCSCTVVV